MDDSADIRSRTIDTQMGPDLLGGFAVSFNGFSEGVCNKEIFFTEIIEGNTTRFDQK